MLALRASFAALEARRSGRATGCGRRFDAIAAAGRACGPPAVVAAEDPLLSPGRFVRCTHCGPPMENNELGAVCGNTVFVVPRGARAAGDGHRRASISPSRREAIGLRFSVPERESGARSK